MSAIAFDPLKDKSYAATRLGSSVVDFLAWMKLGGAAERTVDQYERDLSRGALMYPDKGPADLTDGDMLHIAASFKDKERRVRVAAWRSYCKWLLRTRAITVNPCDALPDMKKRPQPVIDVFNNAEIEALLSHDVIDAAPLGVLLLAGPRKEEARNLKLRHCHNGNIVIINGKGGKDRIVPMEKRLEHLLADLTLLYGVNPDDHIFYGIRDNQHGRRQIMRGPKPIGEGTFARWWRRCLNEAGVRYRTPHTARHTFATRWRQRGLAIDEISILLGHASYDTTASIYVHTNVQDVAAHMALIEALESPEQLA